MKRLGFTLTELLVSLAIIALLLALILPAVQRARESARSVACKSNLHQIGLALHNYESTHGMWPAGAFQYSTSWHVAILPHMDQAPLFQRVNFGPAYGVPPTADIMGIVVPSYLCTSDPSPQISSNEPRVAATNYLGNSGARRPANNYQFDGMFAHSFQPDPRYPEGHVRLSEVTDGASVTAAVAEVLHSNLTNDRLRVAWDMPTRYDTTEHDLFLEACANLPPAPATVGWHGNTQMHGYQWTYGDIGFSTYNHLLPPMQPSCLNGVQTGIYSAASSHGGFVNTLFVDGHTQSISSSVDSNLWTAFGSRNGSEAVSD